MVRSLEIHLNLNILGHDLIAESTWNQLNEETLHWLCKSYKVCNVYDFKTLSILPDLLKHEKRFIKYFNLHFYNNLADHPPKYCSINVHDALSQRQPNLLRAVDVLMRKFKNPEMMLSFTEMSYFIHLLADLHQPFHRKELSVFHALIFNLCSNKLRSGRDEQEIMQYRM